MRFLLRWGVGRKRIPTIAVSFSLAKELQRLTGKTIKVICNGIDHTIFFREPTEGLIASKNGKKVLLLHARTDHRKGFDLACQVVEGLIKKGLSDFIIWTVGERIPVATRGGQFHDFGYVNEKQLRQIMSSADIFLYPSRHEGMPLMPLEAMACGCAVVTTNAVPDLTHQKNALVYDINNVQGLTDGVVRLMTDADLKKKITNQAYQLVHAKDMLNNIDSFSRFLKTDE
jgi:glycosyltransferase involved in cell wall biosynthesis